MPCDRPGNTAWDHLPRRITLRHSGKDRISDRRMMTEPGARPETLQHGDRAAWPEGQLPTFNDGVSAGPRSSGALRSRPTQGIWLISASGSIRPVDVHFWNGSFGRGGRMTGASRTGQHLVEQSPRREGEAAGEDKATKKGGQHQNCVEPYATVARCPNCKRQADQHGRQRDPVHPRPGRSD